MLDLQSGSVVFQLKSMLEDQIRPGNCIWRKDPSEHELCQRYQITSTNSRQAIQDLVRAVNWSEPKGAVHLWGLSCATTVEQLIV